MKRQFLRSDQVGIYPITLSTTNHKVFSVSFILPAVGGDRSDFESLKEAEDFYDKMLAAMKGKKT